MEQLSVDQETLRAEIDRGSRTGFVRRRERNVVVRKQGVDLEQATVMAREYEAGATMAELEKKYQLSHRAVYRALHRTGVEMRARAPRLKSP